MTKTKTTIRQGANCNARLLASAVFALTAIVANAQQRVTGRVVDEHGEPVIGASVAVKGTGTGCVTDIDGRFTLAKVKPDQAIAVSYVGFATQTMTIGNNTSLTVTLKANDAVLDEVVVVGYGSITKRSVSTAMSTVKGASISDMPTSNVTQSLSGLSAGISLQQTSGEPGAAPSIRIRGAGSINSGNDPLYVIDGYPTTDAELFNNLNPSDIDDIQILKDAASSAIYGSKAGNGVIIVTTKRGKAGKPTVSLSTQVGISQVQRKVDVLEADDFLDMVIEARTNNGTINNYPDLVKLRESGNYCNTDWQDAIFRNALNYRANATVTGGNDVVTYSLSVNYQNEDGILLNSYFKKINIKAGFDARLGKHVKVGASFSPSYNKKRSQQPSGGNTEDAKGIIAEALSYPPILPVYQPNGDYTQMAQHYAGKNGTPDYGLNMQLRNPVCNLLENNNDRWALRTLTHAYVEIKPTRYLTVRSAVDFATNSQKTDYYQSAYLFGSAATGNKSTPYLNAINAYRASGFGYDAYWSTTATYDRDLTDKLNLNAVAGYDFEYNSDFSVRQDDRTDADNPIAYLGTSIRNVMGANLWTGSSTNSNYVFDAMFARIILNYDSKYVVSGSLRRDRSSKFGPDNRAGLFYSASAAWNVTEEEWMKPAEWLSLAKVRASYGVTGNDQVGSNYAWVSAISTDHSVVFGTSSVPSYYPSGYSNRSLGWEKNRQIDLGLDLAFIKRINLNIDFYKRTSDIVMPANIPNFNGIAGSVYMNSGQVENKGVEIALNAKVLQGSLNWETTLNWSLNRNKILSLANNQRQLPNGKAGTKWGNVIRNIVGRPMGDMYMLKVIGTYNSEDDLKKYPKYGTESIGDLIYENTNGDNTINTDDYQYVGNYQPDFTYGWTNRLGYKNFDLAITIDGQAGGKVIYAAARAYSLNLWDNVLAESGLGRWHSAEQPGNGTSHKAGTNNLGSNIQPSTRYLYDADFLRIRNIALGYTLPAKACEAVGLQRLRLSVNIQNLWTFDSYPGYSVEANYNGNSATNNGVDFGSYPISRVMTFGINATF